LNRFWTCAACLAVALPLAGCGGGGGGDSRPPITLKGASIVVPDGDLAEAELRRTDGGAGPGIGNVVFVDDGVFEFLGEQTGRLDQFTTVFTADDGSVAFATAPPGYEDSRLLRLEFSQNGVRYVSEGIIGRFTSEDLMAAASGSATYTGTGTATVRADSAFGQQFDLSGGDTVVDVDFDRGRINATLDFSGTASAVGEPIDTVRIDGMRIDGNRFSGGALTASRGGTIQPAYSASGSSLSSSGVFAGWNDTTGSVQGGDRPAEVGGAFVATPGVRTLTGRYLAD
jgi:hypothetical protein